MTLEDIILQVSNQTNIPKDTVYKAYRAYWRAIREHIVSLPLKEDLSDKAFKELKVNVNIPSIGKLCVTLDRYHRMKKLNEIINHKKSEKQ